MSSISIPAGTAFPISLLIATPRSNSTGANSNRRISGAVFNRVRVFHASRLAVYCLSLSVTISMVILGVIF
jgi:hypothetical protein